jgi:hypothetical protein
MQLHLHWSYVYAFDIGYLGPNIFQAVTLIAISKQLRLEHLM